jgi:flagellar protein FlbD
MRVALARPVIESAGQGVCAVIAVTRLNGSELWLNPMLIESVERTPDSVVTLTNGHRYVVRETPSEISTKMQGFFRGMGREWWANPGWPSESERAVRSQTCSGGE